MTNSGYNQYYHEYIIHHNRSCLHSLETQTSFDNNSVHLFCLEISRFDLINYLDQFYF